MTKQEWNKLYKDYPEECSGVSAYELKMLMAYKQELESVTRWDVWLEDYMDELKQRHQHHLLELGMHADAPEKAQEAS